MSNVEFGGRHCEARVGLDSAGPTFKIRARTLASIAAMDLRCWIPEKLPRRGTANLPKSLCRVFGRDSGFKILLNFVAFGSPKGTEVGGIWRASPVLHSENIRMSPSGVAFHLAS